MSSAEAFQFVIESAGETVAGHLILVEQRLADVVRPYQTAVSEPASVTLMAGGKRLRPLMSLVSADVFGKLESEPAIASAAAVELVHMATLVHDDVLDRAPLRRGRPTVFASDGRGVATASGDLMFSLAFSQLVGNARTGHVRSLSSAAGALAQGELIQRSDAWDASVSADRYRLRCELKTGRLFQAAAEMGALSGDAADLAAVLGRFALDVGVAFQMLDDVLDFDGDPARTGKARGTDLLDGTVTLPMIVARDRDDHLATLDVREIKTAEQAGEVCDRVVATGAADAVRSEAIAAVADAKLLLDGVPAQARLTFELMADQMVARTA